MFTIRIEDEQVNQFLDNLMEVGSGRDAFAQVAMGLKQGAYETFRNQSDPYGAYWAPLSPVTLASRQKRGNYSQQINIDKGELYASIETQSSDTEALISMGAGLPDNRAWYVQQGTDRQPARPVFPSELQGLPDSWLDFIAAPFRKQFLDAVPK